MVFGLRTELLPWLTVQAKEVGASIVSTSQLPIRKDTIYEWYPTQLEVEAHYDALGKLINRIEREQPLVDLHSIRLFARQSAPDVPVLRFVVRAMHKERAISVSHEQAPMNGASEWVRSYTYPPGNVHRNPFVVLQHTPEPPIVDQLVPHWPVLSAILWDSNIPTAIVEFQDRIVRVHPGTVIGTVLVAEIEPNMVTFRRADEVREATLWPGIKLNPSSVGSPPAAESRVVSDPLGRLPGVFR